MAAQVQINGPITSSPRKRKVGAASSEASKRHSRNDESLPLQPVHPEEVQTDTCMADEKGGRSVLSTVFSPVFAFFANDENENIDHMEHFQSATSAPPVHPGSTDMEMDEPAALTTLDATLAEDDDDNIDLNTADALDDQLSDLEAALLFIKRLPPLETCTTKYRPPLLPRPTRRTAQKTLVLDLDETLVHSCLEECPGADFVFPVTYEAQELRIHVRMRPHLQTFIEKVSALFELVIFTASQKVYAEQVLNRLDPHRKYFRHRVYRDSCLFVDGNYLKDLTVLGRDLRHTVIVDNSPQAFGFQVNNGIPILSWYDDDSDRQLLELLPFLEGLASVEDVRPCIQSRFKMKEMMDLIDESRFGFEHEPGFEHE